MKALTAVILISFSGYVCAEEPVAVVAGPPAKATYAQCIKDFKNALADWKPGPYASLSASTPGAEENGILTDNGAFVLSGNEPSGLLDNGATIGTLFTTGTGVGAYTQSGDWTLSGKWEAYATACALIVLGKRFCKSGHAVLGKGKQLKNDYLLGFTSRHDQWWAPFTYSLTQPKVICAPAPIVR